MARAVPNIVYLESPEKGVDGRGWISMARDPIISDGRIGDMWFNTLTHYGFGPKTAGGWGAGTYLRGPNGWTAKTRVIADGTRRVREIFDWTGGGGTKPAIGYEGATGTVPDIEDAVDYRGPEGPQALINALDAKTDLVTWETFTALAESASDNEKAPIKRVFEAGGFLPLRTLSDLVSLNVPASIKSVRTQFFAPQFAIPSTMTGGAEYIRVGSEPDVPAAAKRRSIDRLTPEGAHDSANGGWWLLNEEAARPEYFAATRQGGDDTNAIKAAADFARKTGRGKLHLMGGAPYRIVEGNIDFEYLEVSGVSVSGALYPAVRGGTVFEVVGQVNPAFLVGYSQYIRDVTLYYPDQTVGVIAYPPTFRTKNACGFCTWDNVTAINPYNFFHATPVAQALGSMHLKGCRIWSIDTDFHLQRGAPEVIEITSCTFSESAWAGDYAQPAVRNAALAHAATQGVWLKFDPHPSTHQSIDGLTLGHDCIVRGRRRGIDVLAGAIGPCSFYGEWEVTQCYRSADSCASAPTFTFAPSWIYSGVYGGVTGLNDPLFEVRGLTPLGYIVFAPEKIAHTQGTVLLVLGGIKELVFKSPLVRNWGRTSAPGTYRLADINLAGLQYRHEVNIARMPNPIVGNVHDGVLITNCALAFVNDTFIDGANLPYSFQGGTIDFDNISSLSTVGAEAMAIGGSASIRAGKSDLDKGTINGLPAFKATSGAVTYTASVADIAFTFAEAFDMGGNFVSPTFTAPQAGLYDFDLNLGHTAAATSGDVWLIKIVQAGSAANRQEFYYHVPAAVGKSLPTMKTSLRLARGDTVKCTIERFSGSGSFPLINSAAVNSFSGRLVH